MTFRTIKGYVLVVFSGAVLLAAALLLILQWGNAADFTAYGPHVDVNTALLMLFSAAGGILTLLLCWAFLRGLRTLSKARRFAEMEKQRRQTAQRLSELEAAQKQQPEN